MKILKDRRGYTLIEATAAILVLVLLALGISTGLSAAIKVYNTTLYVSESDTLTDTLNTALADVLRTASDGETSGDGKVTFSNRGYGMLQGRLALWKDRLYLYTAPSDKAGIPLIPAGSYCGLSLKDFTLTYDDATGTYSGSYKICSDTHTKDCTFTYRTLFPSKGE